MTTRTNTPSPRDHLRMVLRDKPRDAPSMEGWRIEVRRDLEGYVGRYWSPDATDPNGPNLAPLWYVLAPTVVTERAIAHPMIAACAWTLHDTIYVSRELTEEESSTLRRLMAVEVSREREEISDADHRAILDARMPSLKVAEENAKRAAEMIAKYEPTHIAFNWTPPVLTDAARAQLGAALGRLSEEWRAPLTADGPIKAGQLVTQTPRVPQVGDEVEVRIGAHEWRRAPVTWTNGTQMEVRGRVDEIDRADMWRWPEAKREARADVPIGPVAGSIFKRRNW